jgi:hypothetical protein
MSAFCAAACLLGNRAFLGGRQTDARASRLRKTYGDRLFGRARSVPAFSNVMHLLAHELTRLSAGRFASLLCLFGSPESFFFRHINPAFK